MTTPHARRSISRARSAAPSVSIRRPSPMRAWRSFSSRSTSATSARRRSSRRPCSTWSARPTSTTSISRSSCWTTIRRTTPRFETSQRWSAHNTPTQPCWCSARTSSAPTARTSRAPLLGDRRRQRQNRKHGGVSTEFPASARDAAVSLDRIHHRCVDRRISSGDRNAIHATASQAVSNVARKRRSGPQRR